MYKKTILIPHVLVNLHLGTPQSYSKRGSVIINLPRLETESCMRLASDAYFYA